jgi:cysteinyl-tRNA synthetase
VIAPFRLYNTMTRRVEDFAPAAGTTVRLYTCGPTVYSRAHIGNFRTFLFEDLLRRALRLAGWHVEQVMNLTDVDDKIIARAHAAGVGTTIGAITEPATKQFFADRDYLGIEPAERYPRATDFIPQMIALVERLVAAGLAYRTDDGTVYFAIAKFPAYGRLSRLDLRSVRPGARVAQDDYSKESAQDFALWKAAKPEDEAAGAAWDSPWGRGRPGWHLECSAMAMALLGETIDLHCGAIDLIFPHHEDEIAQSEGATGATFSRHWCHGEFLLTDGAKMAKRVGNVVTVLDLQQAGVSGAAFRHLVFTTHYRQVLNLTDDALVASSAAVAYIGEFAERLELPETVGATPALAAAADEMQARVREALADDLDAPRALAAVFEFVRAGNAELDRRGGGGRDAAALARARDGVGFIRTALGVVPPPRPGGLVGLDGTPVAEPRGQGSRTDGIDPGLAEYVAERLRARTQARSARDFAAADAIRDELLGRGIAIADSGAGTRWKVVTKVG